MANVVLGLGQHTLPTHRKPAAPGHPAGGGGDAFSGNGKGVVRERCRNQMFAFDWRQTRWSLLQFQYVCVCVCSALSVGIYLSDTSHRRHCNMLLVMARKNCKAISYWQQYCTSSNINDWGVHISDFNRYCRPHIELYCHRACHQKKIYYVS